MQGKALWYVAPGRAELREEMVDAPESGEVQVRSLFGAISRGTERLVLAGRVPPSEYERMRAPLMAGTFPFPVKYGYATVGRVEAGVADLRPRVVFSLHPHQSLFTVSTDAVVPVPEQVPAQRAVLAANMETALNAVWDGAPGPADRIAVVGGGLVGLLVAYLCARLPGAEVTVVDIASARAEIAHRIGAHFAKPDAAPRDCDLVFHASGTNAGLATALRLAGDAEESRVHRARSAFSGAGHWSKYRDLQLHGCDFAALAAGERSGISGDPELARQSVLAARPGAQAAGGFRCPKHRRECP